MKKVVDVKKTVYICDVCGSRHDLKHCSGCGKAYCDKHRVGMVCWHPDYDNWPNVWYLMKNHMYCMNICNACWVDGDELTEEAVTAIKGLIHIDEVLASYKVQANRYEKAIRKLRDLDRET